MKNIHGLQLFVSKKVSIYFSNFHRLFEESDENYREKQLA